MAVYSKGMNGNSLGLSNNGDNTYSARVSNFQPFYEYTTSEHTVLDARNNKVLATSGANPNYVYVSEDGGAFIYKAYIPSGTVRMGLITDNDNIIIWSNNGYIYRSTNGGESFIEVLSGVNALLHSSSRDSRNDTICFSTYTAHGTTDYIYTSLDDGLTWEQTATLPAGATHFHNCQWLHQRQSWIATTGDGVMVWLESKDGVEWKEIVRTNDQRFRTLGIISKSNTELLWSSDGGTGNEGVFYVDTRNIDLETDKIEPKDIERNLLMPSTSYACRGWANVGMTGTLVTATQKMNRRVNLYATIDGGETWQLELSFATSDPSHAGFFDVIGPNEDGDFFVVVHNLKGESITNGSIIAKPIFESHKRVY